jgi:YafQ family addiction module toxin component
LYYLDAKESVYKIFMKLAKKDPRQAEATESKIREILANPHKFKPLRWPMQHMRRVHIGSFVLVYDIDEARKIVTIRRYAHHDDAYG